MSLSQLMRTKLAAVGIMLDESRPARAAERAAPTEAQPDRSLIREILSERGAPAKALDWLTASCPSVEDALAYQPPAPIAFCVRCKGPRAFYAYGCVACGAALGGDP